MDYGHCWKRIWKAECISSMLLLTPCTRRPYRVTRNRSRMNCQTAYQSPTCSSSNSLVRLVPGNWICDLLMRNDRCIHYPMVFV
ncbi:uncharacterized protein ARMOST_22100 [Armillaria ostoyae]|uniref:Uncharacterized protein n=1 Tax=Armillaria ostoyae TaxID=47428 RepID=A0A284SC05_ARMOS|nr:uncharacterized protein ARMOST_22100 [Armillaria ostoyae]